MDIHNITAFISNLACPIETSGRRITYIVLQTSAHTACCTMSSIDFPAKYTSSYIYISVLNKFDIPQIMGASANQKNLTHFFYICLVPDNIISTYIFL
jgi:hypothetical protein